MTPFQAEWRERIVRFLSEQGVADVQAKVKRVEFDEGEPEVQVRLTFAVGGEDYEVWLYTDEAAVMEPGDDWWTFDLDEHETADKLGAAILEHLGDVVEELRQA